LQAGIGEALFSAGNASLAYGYANSAFQAAEATKSNYWLALYRSIAYILILVLTIHH
jgi:hypothetical protein